MACIFEDVDDQMWFHNLSEEVVTSHAPTEKRMVKNRQLPYMHRELSEGSNKCIGHCKAEKKTQRKIKKNIGCKIIRLLP